MEYISQVMYHMFSKTDIHLCIQMCRLIQSCCDSEYLACIYAAEYGGISNDRKSPLFLILSGSPYNPTDVCINLVSFWYTVVYMITNPLLVSHVCLNVARPSLLTMPSWVPSFRLSSWLIVFVQQICS